MEVIKKFEVWIVLLFKNLVEERGMTLHFWTMYDFDGWKQMIQHGGLVLVDN